MRMPVEMHLTPLAPEVSLVDASENGIAKAIIAEWFAAGIIEMRRERPCERDEDSWWMRGVSTVTLCRRLVSLVPTLLLQRFQSRIRLANLSIASSLYPLQAPDYVGWSIILWLAVCRPLIFRR